MNIKTKTNRFKKALIMGATLALTFGGLGITASAAEAATYQGGVSMQWACDRQYPGFGLRATVMDQRNAYSWRCAVPWDKTRGIDVNRACRDTYGRNAYAQLRDTRNPYTWYCVK